MSHSNRTTRALRANVITALCGALLTTGAMAANVTLQTIEVTPNAKTISVGQKQSFKATGTFSNGHKETLGPAIDNIALGSEETCALQTSGRVECWGNNEFGKLGDGNTTDSLIPRPVNGITNATAVAVSYHHGCASLSSGSVRCWGYNLDGELGNGFTTNSSTPVPVTGISTATALALGSDHTCALLVSGEVECWGAGSYGQLGHGLYQSSYIPISVIGISTAVAISAAADQTCAVLRSGSVQCWGQNFYGELGNGTKANSNTPVTVTGISSATAVANADLSTCALLASGAVKCWGYDGDGELGDGTNAHDSTIPVTVTGISTAVAIAGGSDHYCAVLRTGSVKCWGQNAYGELGDGTNIPLSDTPVRVRAINSPTRLAAGDQHTCALFSGGLMRCWGWNSSGQLGNREKTNTPNPSPVTVVGTPGVVWESSNLTIATITDRGIATARAAGNTAISATTAGFINDNAVLTVK